MCLASAKLLLVRWQSWYRKAALHLTARRYNFVSVTRRSIRAESSYPALAGPQSCHGARRVRRGFCRPGTNFVAYTSVAVQGWSEAGSKSRCTMFYCGYWSGRGISYYKAVKGVGAEAKTVTSLWIIPSVLGFRAIFYDHVIKVVFQSSPRSQVFLFLESYLIDKIIAKILNNIEIIPRKEPRLDLDTKSW